MTSIETIHEELWEAAFGRLLEYAAVRRSAAVSTPYIHTDGFHLGQWVYRQRRHQLRGNLSPERAARLEALRGWRWLKPLPAERNRHAPVWTDGLKHLCEHADATGSAYAPPDFVCEDGFELGKWISYVRGRHARSDLNAEKIETLAALPGWAFDAFDGRFIHGVECLRRHVDSTGDAAPTVAVIADDGFRLGEWVSNIRHHFMRGRLASDQVAELESVPGWSWDTNAHRISVWEGWLRRMHEYVEKTGTADVACAYVDEGGAALGDWVRSQRAQYHGRHMNQARVAALEALPGWTWGVRDDAWDRGLGELLRFVERTGSAAGVTARVETEEGYLLGRWVRRARFRFTQGTLRPDRVRDLESVPGWEWKGSPGSRGKYAEAWERAFTRLAEYTAEHGTSRVPFNFRCEGGFNLDSWVRRQRDLHRAGRLLVDRVERLEALPDWVWDIAPAAAQEAA